ncbi:unnamed protein product [Cylicocyclus nassatus]|uniref:Uncharacterized protein n=1 Tax=Cylicocyclus nassatus TaxID=53992 RepID=A0AA36DQL3_CYLNA|nr:unnamed protein product [Cylicocyclus nassatus]
MDASGLARDIAMNAFQHTVRINLTNNTKNLARVVSGGRGRILIKEQVHVPHSGGTAARQQTKISLRTCRRAKLFANIQTQNHMKSFLTQRLTTSACYRGKLELARKLILSISSIEKQKPVSHSRTPAVAEMKIVL